MPQWSTQPPKPTEFAGIRLTRVPPRGQIRGLITSVHLLGTYTHFYRQRTIPCEQGDCPACRDGHLPRWHGYVSYISAQTQQTYVLELTALAAQPVADFDDRNGTLRGAVFTATRNGARNNSPVTVTIEPHDTDQRKLPEPVNLERFLETIWAEGTRRAKPTPTANDDTPNDDKTPDVGQPRNRLTAATQAGNNHHKAHHATPDL